MLFPNEGWETGDAGGWTLSGTVKPTVSNLSPRTGLWSLRYVNYSVNFWGGVASWQITDPDLVDALRFSTLTFRCWYRGEPSNNQENKIQIIDELGTASTDMPVNAAWAQYEVSKFITAYAKTITFKLSFVRGGTAPVGAQYVDDMESDPVVFPPLLSTLSVPTRQELDINPTCPLAPAPGIPTAQSLSATEVH
ncbi:MAG: hypothetical protein PHQ43_08250 [Dehalococcoidales bacterium]|nr:hypothetical protein [Dehalococcoidales bacterium]